jgi:hypothetical protein
MYVLCIIQNSILYIGFTYMYVFHIIFCMVLSTWLHTKLLYEGFDNLFVLPNLQTPSFKFSQVIYAPLQKHVLMSFQCKILSQQLCKATSLMYDLGSIWNLRETWKNHVYYHLSKFQLISFHTMKDLATSLKSPLIGIWTQNDLQIAFKNFKVIEILGDT